MKTKKAELTTQQIVGLTILIISFGVLLFFLVRLNLQELTDKEICHNSVVLYDKNPNPLKSNAVDCRTNYVCISSGDKCKDFTPTATREITFGSDEKTNREKVMKQIAEEMSDCWWMFGEGKIDYSKFSVFDDKVCAMCSVIVFDDEIQEKVGAISYDEFYKFLQDAPKDDSQTYLSYLYNTPNIEKIWEPGYLNSKNIIFSQQYFITTGIGKSWLSWGLNQYWIPQAYEEISDGKTIFKEKYSLPIQILEKTEGSFKQLGCDEFITKA